MHGDHPQVRGGLRRGRRPGVRCRGPRERGHTRGHGGALQRSRRARGLRQRAGEHSRRRRDPGTFAGSLRGTCAAFSGARWRVADPVDVGAPRQQRVALVGAVRVDPSRESARRRRARPAPPSHGRGSAGPPPARARARPVWRRGSAARPRPRRPGVLPGPAPTSAPHSRPAPRRRCSPRAPAGRRTRGSTCRPAPCS